MRGLNMSILSNEAMNFLKILHSKHNPTRIELLEARAKRQKILDVKDPDFLEETRKIREDTTWKVAEAPKDLQKRYVEITGPVEKKMMINALNSGADTFMADFEDALSPTWENIIQGQENLQDAIDGTLSFTSPEGKAYHLNEKRATLLVRPRGWHLEEKHLNMSASLVDFGLYFFHNVQKLLKKGTGPYFYLPKLESHLEARLWRDVFITAEDAFDLPRGTIRCTVLIETILAAFEMEEILFELKEYAVGLNAGRWDYIFSSIKKFQSRSELLFPDRSEITMTVPFMRAYTELLVKTCHRRGVHAMGGMAAFVPSRKDPEVNKKAFAKVQEDKLREAKDGFDGTWVAHPDLVPIAMEVFNAALCGKENQKDRLREDVHVTKEKLIDFTVPGGKITEQGVRQNIIVALKYLESWLQGVGAVALFSLMEDAATAEIARAELWQWIHHKEAKLTDGRAITSALYRTFADEEVAKCGQTDALSLAKKLLDELVINNEFKEFLTLDAYMHLA